MLIKVWKKTSADIPHPDQCSRQHFGPPSDQKTFQCNQKFQQNNDAASKEPKLLSRYGKDKVCLWLRDKITVFDGAYIIVIQSLSVKLSGTDRLD